MRVFKYADFISCEDENRTFKYLVEEDGKIIYTGNQLPDVYSRVEPVDLKNRSVIPAFADTHMHFASFAFFNSSFDCRDVHDFAELDELIRKYIAQGKKEKVILGFGCSAHTVAEKRLPQRDDLDKITDHPLMIVKYDGHASVGNAAMIKRLPASILIDPGFDAKTGRFYLNAFYRAVNSISQSVSLPALFNNMIAGSDYLARKGISLVHTSEGVGFPLDLDIDIVRFANRGLPQKFQVFFQTMNIKKVLRRKLLCIALQIPFLHWQQEPMEYLQHILGDRIKNLIPLKSMLDAGLVIASGSDAPCTLPDPIASIYAACNHPNPQESVPVLDALRMHTSACARLSFDENTRGTLTVGKLADFVVLDQNPLQIPVQKLNNVKIEALYLKGEKYDGQENRGSAGLFLDALKNIYPS